MMSGYVSPFTSSAMFTSAKRGQAEALIGLGRREEAAEALREGAELSMGDKQYVEWLWLAQSRLDMIDDPERAIARLTGVHPELKGYPNSELSIAIVAPSTHTDWLVAQLDEGPRARRAALDGRPPEEIAALVAKAQSEAT